MKIEQFEDKNLSHYSYAILSECEQQVVLIDPSRNPQPYYEFAETYNAKIIGVIETHTHADFVSSHLEIAEATGANIYVSERVKALYPHIAFDEGDSVTFGKIRLSAINTPGHSPDSICILLEHNGAQKAVFTGDTLFIGDCGRPDLRENAGSIRLDKNELAKMMYHSLHEKLATLNDDVVVYPAHGAGTLCGKNLSSMPHNTIGAEKQTNWSLQPQTADAFVKELLADQPFIPAYFPFDVELNRKGAPPFRESINSIVISDPLPQLKEDTWIIDTRPEADYKAGSLPYSVNLMSSGKFETWLGAIIVPGEPFYLAAGNHDERHDAIARAATIGYEAQIKAAFIINRGPVKLKPLDVAQFRKHIAGYTIIDVRNNEEVKLNRIFENSIGIPLGCLRQGISKIPLNKPIVVHCAGGYRSAAASSLIRAIIPADVDVYDLGEAVKLF
ncbi:MAG: MBL fold metallo-hydrolase [Niabella sp.]